MDHHTSTRVELVIDAQAALGEGSLWDARRQVLYWLDIQESRLHVYDPARDENRTVRLPQQAGTVVPCSSGGVMLAMRNGFFHLDLETEELTFIHDPESHLPDNRFNDGKCDPAGRFWAGTMSVGGKASGAGSLYCMDADRSVRRMLEHVTISNGIAWSPDNTVMYYIDTPTRQIAAFDYDLQTGSISNRRVAFVVPDEQGHPDGMTLDADGMLWVAHWAGGQVSRWDPHSGRQLQSVRLPASQVTSCAFGGPGLDELYVTTARTALDEQALSEQPLAGGLFRARPGVRGVPAYEFAG